MTRSLGGMVVPVALALAGCTGESHTTERPLVEDCSTATSSGLQGDPCAFEVECGAGRDDMLRSAVCDNGTLLTSVIEQETVAGEGGCDGARIAEAAVRVSFTIAERGCVDVELCADGGGGVRSAHVCQNGFATSTGEGEPWIDCPLAVQMGGDGDPCAGGFACIADRVIGPAGVLPILGWCDDDTLRLAPSQTLLFGPPEG